MKTKYASGKWRRHKRGIDLEAHAAHMCSDEADKKCANVWTQNGATTAGADEKAALTVYNVSTRGNGAHEQSSQ